MAEEATKDAGATFYDMRTMNRWFLGSIAVMTLSYCWSVVDDHEREWKGFQREFFELERQLAVEQGQDAFKAAGGKAILSSFEEKSGAPVPGALDLEIERLRGLLAADHETRPKLVEALAAAEFAARIATADMKAAKADYEAERYHYEEEAHAAGEVDLFQPGDEDVREALAEYKELEAEFLRLDGEAKRCDAELAAAKDALASHDALAEDVARQLEDREREVGRHIKRADTVDPERTFNRFRNSIFFNFMAPTETPRKFVVREIFDDLNFLEVPKVDMCTTCHLATDRYRDYEAGNADVTFEAHDDPSVLPPQFRSHSRPELFCTSLSPHDQERFGCSGCHSGGNQRLSFQLAGHTPTDLHEKEVWEREHDWHSIHYWDHPMLGSQFVDASCWKCHQDEVHIPGADQWNRGRDLVAKLGCYGCHKMQPFDGARKVGPPLSHVASKFADLDFMLKWVDDPRKFRPSTRMPSFFHRENRAMEHGRDAAEVTALVTYLYSLGTPQAVEAYPGGGDPALGKRLFGELGGVGCLGCHSIDDHPTEQLDDLRHGPDLSAIGSKVTADWLWTWIRDPKSLWAETNMPSLRLTDEEAKHIVAYLLTKRDPAFEQAGFAKPADDSMFDRILIEKLTERMTEARAREQVAAMSGFEKRRRAGEYLLNHYGCFGCHDIPGYEDAMPIGTELNGWGSKHADRLDFGMVEMDWKQEEWFNRVEWLDHKLRNTRYYDRLKDKRPFEKLKMPQFSQLEGPVRDLHDPGAAHAAESAPGAVEDDRNADDRQAVMTFVFSLVKDNTAESIKNRLTPAEAAVERGRRIVREKNCLGCHMLYGEGGEIRVFADAEAQRRFEETGEGDETAKGAAYYPPLLDGQGARTQPDWLFRFLDDPVLGAGRGPTTLLRPWLKARMPTFGFSQQELNDLVAYFAHEEVGHTALDKELWAQAAAKFEGDFAGYDARSLRTADAGKKQLHQVLVAREYERRGGKYLHEVDFPYLTRPEELSPAMHERGREFFISLGCALCHAPGGRVPKGKTAADMAPDLAYARERLGPRWIKHWFENPQAFQPGTRMPGLWPLEEGGRPSVSEDIGDADAEMELIRDYLFTAGFAEEFRKIAEETLIFDDPPK